MLNKDSVSPVAEEDRTLERLNSIAFPSTPPLVQEVHHKALNKPLCVLLPPQLALYFGTLGITLRHLAVQPPPFAAPQLSGYVEMSHHVLS